MTTGLRRLNFTSRVRIKREHVSVGLLAAPAGTAPRFRAAIDLSGYSLAPSALVCVEAHRNPAYQRFDLGTVAEPLAAPPDGFILEGFGTGEGVHFRVKVVEPPGASGRAARILARADNIIPTQEGRRRSLLPMEPVDLGDEVWRFEIQDEATPIVYVNKSLGLDRQSLARSPEFISLVLPGVLRDILEWALEPAVPEEHAEDDPRWPWVQYALSLLGRATPPPELSEDGLTEFKGTLIDKAVGRFCRTAGVAKRMKEWLKKGRA